MTVPPIRPEFVNQPTQGKSHVEACLRVSSLRHVHVLSTWFGVVCEEDSLPAEGQEAFLWHNFVDAQAW